MTTGTSYTPNGHSIWADHTRLGDERFVALARAVGDSTRRVRPAFCSDAGRRILGRGGVTPDVIVASDTLTTGDLALARASGDVTGEWFVALYHASRDMAPSRPDFVVDERWRELLWLKLQQTKAPVTRRQLDSGSALVRRSLASVASRLAFDDSGSFRRGAPNDQALVAALGYLRRAPSQRRLLALVPASDKTKG